MFFVSDDKMDSSDILREKIYAECDLIEFIPNKCISKKMEKSNKIEFKMIVQEPKKVKHLYCIKIRKGNSKYEIS